MMNNCEDSLVEKPSDPMGCVTRAAIRSVSAGGYPFLATFPRRSGGVGVSRLPASSPDGLAAVSPIPSAGGEGGLERE